MVTMEVLFSRYYDRSRFRLGLMVCQNINMIACHTYWRCYINMMIKRVDGHNCMGCYSLKRWRDVYYCRSCEFEDGIHYNDQLGFHVVKFWNRVITEDEMNNANRPSWCPIENE